MSLCAHGASTIITPHAESGRQIENGGEFKKSQRGCCRVVKTGDGYDYVDGLTWAEAQDSNELRTVFRDGKFEKQFTLDEVRKNLHGGTF